jgi:hypothetical protein
MIPGEEKSMKRVIRITAALLFVVLGGIGIPRAYSDPGQATWEAAQQVDELLLELNDSKRLSIPARQAIESTIQRKLNEINSSLKSDVKLIYVSQSGKSEVIPVVLGEGEGLLTVIESGLNYFVCNFSDNGSDQANQTVSSLITPFVGADGSGGTQINSTFSPTIVFSNPYLNCLNKCKDSLSAAYDCDHVILDESGNDIGWCGFMQGTIENCIENSQPCDEACQAICSSLAQQTVEGAHCMACSGIKLKCQQRCAHLIGVGESDL